MLARQVKICLSLEKKLLLLSPAIKNLHFLKSPDHMHSVKNSFYA